MVWRGDFSFGVRQCWHELLMQIGTLAAIYPGVWGICQLFTGAYQDLHWTQVVDRRRNGYVAIATAFSVLFDTFAWFVSAAVLFALVLPYVSNFVGGHR